MPSTVCLPVGPRVGRLPQSVCHNLPHPFVDAVLDCLLGMGRVLCHVGRKDALVWCLSDHW